MKPEDEIQFLQKYPARKCKLLVENCHLIVSIIWFSMCQTEGCEIQYMVFQTSFIKLNLIKIATIHNIKQNIIKK
jgi:hypothetical protein